MYRLVRFFKRYYAVFLFVLLEAGAISYYANSTSYTRATLLAGAARVTGGIEGFFASAGDYFSLRRENAVLLERLAEAETRLHAAIPADDTLGRPDGRNEISLRNCKGRQQLHRAAGQLFRDR